MKIAVTGAGGHLGSEIIKTLVKETDDTIIGVTRVPDKATYRDIEIRKADYDSQTSYEKALRDIEIVLMISGMEAPDKRIEQHRHVINAAKNNGVRKFLFTSFTGNSGNTVFDALLKSYRQTEADIHESGMEWSIGRDGLYIEPDMEYIDKYIEAGEIANCAGNGLAPYTTRKELAFAYSQMILHDDRNGKTFNLFGEKMTQQQLTSLINKHFNTNLSYREMTPEDYLDFQQKVNGKHLGKIVAGIYTKIRNGELDTTSDFEKAAGRKHLDWETYFEQYT